MREGDGGALKRRALTPEYKLQKKDGDVDEKRKGAQEVLELFLDGMGSADKVSDDDDDIFVTMISWGGVLLLLGLFCVKWFDVVESCTMTVPL